MNIYIMLFAAIACEVLGTMLLPASQNFSKLLPTTILLFSYGSSFYLLALLSQKLPLAIIYASWFSRHFSRPEYSLNSFVAFVTKIVEPPKTPPTVPAAT